MADGASCHSREKRESSLFAKKSWMPAFAGMTGGRAGAPNTQIFVAAQKLLL
jgi:hypothetical protein